MRILLLHWNGLGCKMGNTRGKEGGFNLTFKKKKKDESCPSDVTGKLEDVTFSWLMGEETLMRILSGCKCSQQRCEGWAFPSCRGYFLS